MSDNQQSAETDGAFLKALRAFGIWLLANIIPFALVALISTTYGFHRGYRVGSIDMRDATMCVLDRVSGVPIGKGESAYCRSIGEAINKRPPVSPAHPQAAS
jgi:hypothetical protein